MLERLKAALDATGLPFAAYGWSKAPEGDWGVYAQDGANDLHASDRHAETAVEGTVDWFTRHAPSEAVTAIQEALDGLEGVSWYLNSVQFETDTGLLHFEWVFQDAGG